MCHLLPIHLTRGISTVINPSVQERDLFMGMRSQEFSGKSDLYLVGVMD